MGRTSSFTAALCCPFFSVLFMFFKVWQADGILISDQINRVDPDCRLDSNSPVQVSPCDIPATSHLNAPATSCRVQGSSDRSPRPGRLDYCGTILERCLDGKLHQLLLHGPLAKATPTWSSEVWSLDGSETHDKITPPGPTHQIESFTSQIAPDRKYESRFSYRAVFNWQSPFR
jgi:hypothetical protein